jgi:hypothetical protein
LFRAKKARAAQKKAASKTTVKKSSKEVVVKMAILTNAPKRAKRQQYAWQQLARLKAA